MFVLFLDSSAHDRLSTTEAHITVVEPWCRAPTILAVSDIQKHFRVARHSMFMSVVCEEVGGT